MAKIKTNIDNDFCPQALFLYGTKQEDGQPHCEQLVKNDKRKLYTFPQVMSASMKSIDTNFTKR